MLSGSSEEAEKSQFAATVDDQSEKGPGDAHDGDEEGDGFESVGNDEGAVENANGFGAQVTIGKNQDVAIGSELLNGFANIVCIGRGSQKDSEVGGNWIRDIAEGSFAIHEDIAAFGGIVRVNIGDTEIGARFAEGKCDGVAGLHVMFVGEGFADDDVVGAVQFSENRFRGRPEKKSELR